MGLLNMDAALWQHYSRVHGARQILEPEEVQSTFYSVDRSEDKMFNEWISACTRYEPSHEGDDTGAVGWRVICSTRIKQSGKSGKDGKEKVSPQI